jgi:hypothetical protein
VAGRQTVDGTEAIELKSRPGSPIFETIWVSPQTYLPVRVVVSSAPGAPTVRQTANFTWLPPTAQNLAKLTVPVPAGFRKVSLPEAIMPNLKQIPGVPLPKQATLCPTTAGGACKNKPPVPAPAQSPLALPRLALPFPRLGLPQL